MANEAKAPVTGPGAFTSATGRSVEEDGADKPRYRRYQYDLIRPHCGRSVLEVGAGLGEFAAQLTGLDRLVVTDVDPDAVTLLKARFPAAEVSQFDLTARARLDRPVDTAIAINVLEHFEDEAGVLALLARSVVPGGTIVVWVPGHQGLFSDFDRRVGHVRRYTPASLRRAAERAGLGCELVRSVNLLGGLAWWAAMRVGGTQKPNPGAVGLYDRILVPATRVADRALPIRFGQSVLGVLRAPGGQR
jgi:SAM-dependent methyltransferase